MGLCGRPDPSPDKTGQSNQTPRLYRTLSTNVLTFPVDQVYSLSVLAIWMRYTVRPLRDDGNAGNRCGIVFSLTLGRVGVGNSVPSSIP